VIFWFHWQILLSLIRINTNGLSSKAIVFASGYGK
jgi:hypothetical protein